MIQTVTKCDVCGIGKKDTNNWLVVCKAPGLFQVYKSFYPPTGVVVSDVCGAECLMKILSTWIQQMEG